MQESSGAGGGKCFRWGFLLLLHCSHLANLASAVSSLIHCGNCSQCLMLAQLKVLILRNWLFGFFLTSKSCILEKICISVHGGFFFFQRLCFELLAVEVRGETLQENITHAGRCKPPEHSEQINASPSRQERLVTYIYLSAAHRLSLKTLRMCDEGLSKLLSASNFKSLESFDTPVRNSRQLSESTLSLLSALLCTTVVTLLYNICRDTKIYFLYGSTLVDEDSMKMKMKTSWTLGS